MDDHKIRETKDFGETKDFEMFNKWEVIRDLAGLIVVLNIICYMLLIS